MSQQSINELPEHQQDAALRGTRAASRKYPSVLIENHLVHVLKSGGDWEVWVNCEDADFTGLCVGVGSTRDLAVGQAVKALEAVVEFLQSPPRP